MSVLLHATDLGHQTAQRILHASDPLQSMQEINQNFPSIVSSLSRMKVDVLSGAPFVSSAVHISNCQ
jgi:hypothetical protein